MEAFSLPVLCHPPAPSNISHRKSPRGSCFEPRSSACAFDALTRARLLMGLCTKASGGAPGRWLLKRGSRRNLELMVKAGGCREGPSRARCSPRVSFVAWAGDGTYPSESPQGGGGKKLTSCRRRCLEVRGDKGKGVPPAE